MADSRPIGMMDSGFGGIAVLKAAMEALPNEDFIFYGDNGNAPYGVQTMQQIKRLAMNCAEKLAAEGVKLIVIACNTATSAAIKDIRAQFQLPVLSMEPAIKPAIEASDGRGKILMLATPATCHLQRYIDLRERLDTRKQVIDIGCCGLVEGIESSLGRPRDFEPILHDLLAPFEGERIDAIVLGCTHFTFVQKELVRFASRHFHGPCLFFDGRQGTVRYLSEVLRRRELQSDGTVVREVRLMTSGDEQRVLPAMRKILGMEQQRATVTKDLNALC